MVKSLVYSAWWEFFKCSKRVTSGLQVILTGVMEKPGLLLMKELPPLHLIMKHLMK